MGDSHRHLIITEQEWLAFMDDLQQTLDKFGVLPSSGHLSGFEDCCCSTVGISVALLIG
jgi:hypothetical protein